LRRGRRMEYKVCIGFYAEDYERVLLLMHRLQRRYPDQKWKIYAFPESRVIRGRRSFDYVLVVFTDDYNKAHRIGTALVKKHLPKIGMKTRPIAYWVKEV